MTTRPASSRIELRFTEAGAFVSAAAIAGSFASHDSALPMSLFGAGAIVFLPLCYGVLGFVSTLIMAWLYNVAASVVGGVEIQTQ